jgi:hypothetical protein
MIDNTFFWDLHIDEILTKLNRARYRFFPRSIKSDLFLFSQFNCTPGHNFLGYFI